MAADLRRPRESADGEDGSEVPDASMERSVAADEGAAEEGESR
jgi:hypothetical protein